MVSTQPLLEPGKPPGHLSDELSLEFCIDPHQASQLSIDGVPLCTCHGESVLAPPLADCPQMYGSAGCTGLPLSRDDCEYDWNLVGRSSSKPLSRLAISKSGPIMRHFHVTDLASGAAPFTCTKEPCPGMAPQRKHFETVRTSQNVLF